ncbi:hypothetical protein ON010_g3455 [Phytophthora cinnamomi]|nr:hypothetical protein ON010_g3455 [Phytophthora cinnamomi]
MEHRPSRQRKLHRPKANRNGNPRGDGPARSPLPFTCRSFAQTFSVEESSDEDAGASSAPSKHVNADAGISLEWFPNIGSDEENLVVASVIELPGKTPSSTSVSDRPGTESSGAIQDAGIGTVDAASASPRNQRRPREQRWGPSVPRRSALSGPPARCAATGAWPTATRQVFQASGQVDDAILGPAVHASWSSQVHGELSPEWVAEFGDGRVAAASESSPSAESAPEEQASDTAGVSGDSDLLGVQTRAVVASDPDHLVFVSDMNELQALFTSFAPQVIVEEPAAGKRPSVHSAQSTQDGGSGNAAARAPQHCLPLPLRAPQARVYQNHLAHVFNKTEHTTGNWLQIYYETGVFQRARTTRERKYTNQQRIWLFNYYQLHPLSYLDEDQDAFRRAHGTEISKASVWHIIHSIGLTWKVLERRAIHIKELDVFRFVEELSHLDWNHQNHVFLDEVSFYNRGMVRQRGYTVRGNKKIPASTASSTTSIRKARSIGWGSPSAVKTWCTRRRGRYASTLGRIQSGSWMETTIRHPEIIHYRRNVGVDVIFLPMYCPFFDPIEFLFGYVNRSFRWHYSEASGRDLTPFVVRTFQRFKAFDMSKVFDHCGWKKQGYFDPVGPLSNENRAEPAAS